MRSTGFPRHLPGVIFRVGCLNFLERSSLASWVSGRPGGCLPGPPEIRTRRFPASGSSGLWIRCAAVDRMHDAGRRQRVTCEEQVVPIRREVRPLRAPAQPRAPGAHHLVAKSSDARVPVWLDPSTPRRRRESWRLPTTPPPAPSTSLRVPQATPLYRLVTLHYADVRDAGRNASRPATASGVPPPTRPWAGISTAASSTTGSLG